METVKDSEVIYSIRQRKLFHRIEWKVCSDKVIYSNEKLFHSLQREIPFEELTFKKIYERSNNIPAIILAVSTTVFLIGKTISIFYEQLPDFEMYFVLMGLSFLFLLLAYNYSSKYILIEASIPKLLFLYESRPSSKEVRKFLDGNKEIGMKYFIEKYIDNINVVDLTQKKNNI